MQIGQSTDYVEWFSRQEVWIVGSEKETKPAAKNKLAAFADDDSDDDKQKVAKDIARQAQRKQTDKKVQSRHQPRKSS